ncbi:MAG: NAD(P)/FAD-dependent oxidoreductase [Anaerolineales bacterium]
MNVAILGAGAGGLAAAYDLARAGWKVTVFEAADHVGGLASGFRIPGWDSSVEKFYHHWFASDRHILGLIDELGLRDRVLFPWPVTAVYHEGRFFPLDGPLSRIVKMGPEIDRIPGAGILSRVLYLLGFPALRPLDKIRYLLAAAFLVLTPSWKPLENVTAHQWLRRWMGRANYETLWEPLLVGKFGPHYQDVNMAWFWARVKARTPRLGTFEGGFQAFMDALAERVRAEGAEIRLGTPIERITRHPGGGLEVTSAGSQASFDHVLVTTSPALLARLAPELPPDYLRGLLDLKSMGAVVLILALKHRLSQAGVYWHNLPKSAGFPFLALVEHTQFVPPERFGGDHLVYCGDYLDPSHEYFRLSQDELLARFLPSLTRFNPAFQPDWVRQSWLFRTPYAQPVPPVGHSRAVPDIATPIPSLWLASMSQVYPWDRGTNFAVEIGRRAAQRMQAPAGAGTKG